MLQVDCKAEPSKEMSMLFQYRLARYAQLNTWRQSYSRGVIVLKHKVLVSLPLLIKRIDVWRETYRQRQALARLSDAVLKDIGITRYDAEQESSKPFWRG